MMQLPPGSHTLDSIRSGQLSRNPSARTYDYLIFGNFTKLAAMAAAYIRECQTIFLPLNKAKNERNLCNTLIIPQSNNTRTLGQPRGINNNNIL